MTEVYQTKIKDTGTHQDVCVTSVNNKIKSLICSVAGIAAIGLSGCHHPAAKVSKVPIPLNVQLMQRSAWINNPAKKIALMQQAVNVDPSALQYRVELAAQLQIYKKYKQAVAEWLQIRSIAQASHQTRYIRLSQKYIHWLSIKADTKV